MNTRDVSRPVRRWAEPAARVGLMAKGVVYIVVGMLAVRAAIGWGGRATDTRGALQTVNRQQTLGDVLLALIAVGLVAYVFWRFVQALLDLDGKGSDPKGLAVRAGYIGSGLAYAGLAVTAAAMASGGAGGSRSDQVRRWTAVALEDPGRWWLVAAAGLAVLGGAAYQFHKAYTAKFEKRLRLSGLSADGRRWIRRVGRFGLAARGVTFGIIGWFLLQAGMHANPGQARGLAGALAVLRRQDYGPFLLGAVGLGLVSYGAFSIVEGRYRQINGRA
ncbi:MAG TPA: DUF1206 domain-containing protein [Vicinamibacteria bacterium]